jgi:hypothetical protein
VTEAGKYFNREYNVVSVVIKSYTKVHQSSQAGKEISQGMAYSIISDS